jgi:hypothetical protein
VFGHWGQNTDKTTYISVNVSADERTEEYDNNEGESETSPLNACTRFVEVVVPSSSLNRY